MFNGCVKVTEFCWPPVLWFRTWKCKYPRKKKSKLMVVLFYMFFILSFLTGPQRMTEHVTDFFLLKFFFYLSSATRWDLRQHRRNPNSSLITSPHCKNWSLIDSPGPDSAEFVWRLAKPTKWPNHPSLLWSTPQAPSPEMPEIKKGSLVEDCSIRKCKGEQRGTSVL